MTVADEEFERNVEAAVSAIAERNKEAEAPSPQSEKPGPEGSSRDSTESDYQQRRKDISQASSGEENPAVAGLLRTIQKPLSTIGRIFSDEPDSQSDEQSQQQISRQRLAPAQFDGRRRSTETSRTREGLSAQQMSRYDAQEAAARQASAEAAEARRIQRAEHNDVVE